MSDLPDGAAEQAEREAAYYRLMADHNNGDCDPDHCPFCEALREDYGPDPADFDPEEYQ